MIDWYGKELNLFKGNIYSATGHGLSLSSGELVNINGKLHQVISHVGKEIYIQPIKKGA